MAEDQFWTLVAESGGDAHKLVGFLTGLSWEEIIAFDMRLDEAMYQLDRQDIHEITDGSDDGFEFVRLWIISRGREYFESVLRDPDNAPHFADNDEENEDFGYAATDAYEEMYPDLMPTYPIKRCTRTNVAGWA